MKKSNVLAIAASLLAIVMLTSCASKTASPRPTTASSRSTSSKSSSSSQASANASSTPSASLPAAAATSARLSDNFYYMLGANLTQLDILGRPRDTQMDPSRPNWLALGTFSSTRDIGEALQDEARQAWPMYYLTLLEELAADDGHPTPYNLSQYGTGTSYMVPATVAQNAILSWYGVNFDVSQLQASLPYATAQYHADTDMVEIGIDGLGSSPPFSMGDKAVVDSFTSGMAQAHVDVNANCDPDQMDKEIEWFDDPVHWYTIYFLLEEHADGTYTLHSVEKKAVN
ncbi:hypothetical protein LJB76_03110 [Clostridia bacterium OttesenSCG-928-O13]|nr:hypothetical protein [Clostridia bacterium OttesenSCG-928-O13]